MPDPTPTTPPPASAAAAALAASSRSHGAALSARDGGLTVLTRRSPMPVDASSLDAWHARHGAFERLVPPWERLRVERTVLPEGAEADASPLTDGTRVHLAMRRGPATLRWVARHEARQPGRGFRDVQERGPFARWEHTHRFEPLGAAGRSELVDEIRYALPMGALGRLVMGGAIAKDLDRTFAFRHKRTGADLARHAEAEAEGMSEPWRVAISGASGLVGKALAAFLTTGGHRVDRLVRREPAEGTTDIRWDPANGAIDTAALEGVDAVIHLAGENVAQRWTDAAKDRILKSRTKGTFTVAEACAQMERPPKVLVCASAIGIYGDRGDERVDEASARGEGFLSDVVEAWEDAARPAREAGIRVVHARIGVVMDPNGGALAKLLPVFKAGAGGPVGAGTQGMSWVSLDDTIYALHRALWDERLDGPVNVVSPNPASNKAFSKALGRALGRPAFMPAPAFAIKAMFGAMGQETVLSGSFVQPSVLEGLGHRFEHPDLEPALRFVLGRPAGQ